LAFTDDVSRRLRSAIYDTLAPPAGSSTVSKDASGVLQKQKRRKIMTTTTKQKPTHTAYIVTGQGDKANWHEIGAVWAHKDESGFDLTIVEGISVSGRIVCRERKPGEAGLAE
jgi:hypothetical protein